jgi:hypothetical protein
MNIITGEKFQFFCDHFIGTQPDFYYNPKVGILNEKHIDIKQLNSYFNNKRNIFCYTHLLDNIDLLIYKLSFFTNDFILIFHNSDHNFQEIHLKLFNSLSKLKKIYTQNMNIIYENVYPLPIGIANSMWPHGNLSLLNKIIELNNPKYNFIYFNFNIDTNREKRIECYNKILSKNISFLQNQNQEYYLQNLSSYQYAICPEGNGIDCHRMWECLYLKVIPICKRNILVEYFSRIYPIVILDDWLDLNISSLQKNYSTYSWENYDKLSFDYYRKHILSDK